MRGGGPAGDRRSVVLRRSSPHARGWSRVPCRSARLRVVFPACAGVVPGMSTLWKTWKCLPRMRGGGPGASLGIPPGSMSSPHARGWSVVTGAITIICSVFPACARGSACPCRHVSKGLVFPASAGVSETDLFNRPRATTAPLLPPAILFTKTRLRS